MARNGRAYRSRHSFGDNIAENLYDMAENMAAMPRNMCDMLRAKAESMGHAAKNLPDSVWNRYVDMQDKSALLFDAKLYVEQYMMGNLNPQEFANMMAEDDKLRYTISDLCRMRLEPVTPDIQRNDRYVDVGAGIKTFWTEIRVPLPSELDAARDIRNINFGIEAGRATAGVRPVQQMPEMDEEPRKKRSFSETLREARRKLAEKIMPDDEKKGRELDESWFETDEGRAYHDEYTRRAAQHIENVAMDIEASKSGELGLEDARRAARAAAEPIEPVFAGMPTADELSRYEGDEEYVTDDITGERVYWPDLEKVNLNSETYEKLADWATESEKEQAFMERFTATSPEFEQAWNDMKNGKEPMLKQNPGESEVMFLMRRETMASYLSIKTAMEEVPESSDDAIMAHASIKDMAKLQMYTDVLAMHRDRELEQMRAAAESMNRGQETPRPFMNHRQTAQETPSSGYTAEELNRPLNDEMKALFDQIMQHVDNDRTARRDRPQDDGRRRRHDRPQEGQDDNRRRRYGNDRPKDREPRPGYIKGEFEGKSVSIKGSWSGHTFTEDETDKLFSGETISVGYTDKNGKPKTVNGKLEWQEYNGRQYLNFKADFGRKNDKSQAQDAPGAAPQEPAADDSLFTAQDEDLMHYGMDASEGADDYYEHLAQDMASYQPGDIPESYDDAPPELSAADVDALFANEAASYEM